MLPARPKANLLNSPGNVAFGVPELRHPKTQVPVSIIDAYRCAALDYDLVADSQRLMFLNYLFVTLVQF